MCCLTFKYLGIFQLLCSTMIFNLTLLWSENIIYMISILFDARIDLRHQDSFGCVTVIQLYLNLRPQMLRCVWLLATPWTVACQAPLFIGFPRQEYWSGLPFPGTLPSPAIIPRCLGSPVLAGGFFADAPSGKPPFPQGLLWSVGQKSLCCSGALAGCLSHVRLLFCCWVVSDSFRPHGL